MLVQLSIPVDIPEAQLAELLRAAGVILPNERVGAAGLPPSAGAPPSGPAGAGASDTSFKEAMFGQVYKLTTPGVRGVLDFLADREGTWVTALELANGTADGDFTKLNGYLGSWGRRWKQLTNGAQWPFEWDRSSGGFRYRMGKREADIIRQTRDSIAG